MKYNNRIELLWELNSRGIKNACEVGVQEGKYSANILTSIQSIEKLYLVDLWEHQENYVDVANVSNEKHELYLNRTKDRLKPWSNKYEILRGFSTDMCDSIPDASLDWCYIDARHDYKGCLEDIKAYWPKIKHNGVISGHDYLNSDQVKKITPNQDWSVCYDGTINTGAVKGAVDEFAKSVDRQVFVGWREPWPTWTIIK